MSKTPLRFSVPTVIVVLSGAVAVALAVAFVIENFIAN